MLMELIVFGSIDIILESVAWGSCGYIFFRFIGLNQKYWYWDYLLVCAVYTLWLFWSDAFFASLDISIGNQEFLALFDNDIGGLFETDYLDIAVGMLEIFLGYLLGRFLMKKLRVRWDPRSATGRR